MLSRNNPAIIPTSLLLYLQSAHPPIIFAAFQKDCAERGIVWYSSKAQQLAVNLFIRHPVSKRYPPRFSTLRSLLKHYITLIEQPHIMTEFLNDDENGTDDPVQLELMEAYIRLSVMEGDHEHRMCYKTFFNPFVMVRGFEKLEEDMEEKEMSNSNENNNPSTSTSTKVKASSSTSTNEETREQALERKKKEAVVMAMFCPVRVASKQFSNVGLSLWPAAFVLVQILAQELKGTSHMLSSLLFPNRGKLSKDSEISEADRLHILELGAGVGLTPILLHRMHSYRKYVSAFVLTDYQPLLLENIKRNLSLNSVTVVDDLHAAARGLEGNKQPPFHAVLPLNWANKAETESLMVDWCSDVVLAADCIYDVDTIPALVSCIESALTVPLINHYLEYGLTSPKHNEATRTSANATCKNKTSNDMIDFEERPQVCSTMQNRGNSKLKGNTPSTANSGNNNKNNNKNDGSVSNVSGSWGSASNDITNNTTANNYSNSNSNDEEGNNNNNNNNNNDDADNSENLIHTSHEVNSKNAKATNHKHKQIYGSERIPVCIIVQTHRQNSTMKVFFDAVRKFAKVQSYSLVRGTYSELIPRLSATLDGTDGGIIPLEDWHLLPDDAHNDTERIFCGLQPDVVLEDGGLESMRATLSPSTSISNTSAAGLSSQQVQRSKTSASASNENKLSRSMSITMSFENTDSCEGAAKLQALLKDEMIGPFYVPMAGLIGVHILTNKEEAS